MSTLWLAIFIYSVGLGLVLHFRPALMFQANGAWKEFGYKRAPESRYTIFPVWLFAIVWAVLSYAIAAAITTVWFPSTAAVAATAYVNGPFSNGSTEEYDDDMTMLPASNFAPEPAPPPMMEEEEDEETMEFTMPVRRPRGRPRKQPRPGYYVLDPASREGGLRQYVYYGPEPPTNSNAPTTRVEM
jgi:hypothetical protein